MMTLRMPQAVYLGATEEAAANIVGGFKRAALFTDKMIRQAGLTDAMERALDKAGISLTVLDGLPAEPTVHEAAEAVKRFREIGADLIVAIGGGSVMDMAKLASILDTDNYTVYDLLENPALAKKTVFTLMIPTTAGTGAEATPNAIVTVPEQALKIGIVNASMIPDAVILDAEMIRKLPRHIAASTGIDALAHAIECFTSNKATPLSNMYALEAFRLIEANIESACEAGEPDMVEKENMLFASFLAGVAITASGTTGVHALSYPLGGRYRIAHGISNAILLMPVMHFNESACRSEFAVVYDRVRPQGDRKTEEEKSAWVLERMAEIVKNVGIIPDLSAHGVGREDLEELVSAGMKVTRLLNNNKRIITPDDARAIYMEVM